MSKGLLIAFVLLVIFAALGAWALSVCESDRCLILTSQKIRAADSFERCAELGFPVMESYPRQCRAGDKTFTEAVPLANDKIKITSPLPNTRIESPLVVTGEARGSWYFEASFPVSILDANGAVIAQVPAQAQGEWMTTEFVPFRAVINFPPPATPTGTVVFDKDNPSGLPENADSVSIPVRFGAFGEQAGLLEGAMTLGPICPVEREGETCYPTPEQFAARKIFVKQGSKTAATITPDATGRFAVILPPGDYSLTMERSPVGGITGLPETVRIETGKTVRLSIDVDTGIR